MQRTCRIGAGVASVTIGGDRPLCVIAGPCSHESLDESLAIASRVREACDRLGMSYVFKASFDKANRTSANSRRGVGMERALRDFETVRERVGCPATTDVHLPEQAGPVSQAVELLQIPAFLCRQTDLLVACAEAASSREGGAVNVKKGQFLSPREMLGPIGKLESAGCASVMVTERGTFFGYHRLVNDFAGVADLMELRGAESPPVCFDATHSTQLPGASETSGGRPERAAPLARAAVAVGVDAVFLECHPEPSRAVSDASSMLTVDAAIGVLESLRRVRDAVRGVGAAAR